MARSKHPVVKSNETILERPLSLGERYEFTNVTTGQGHNIFYLYRYPSANDLPSAQLLRERVAAAQHRVQHLYSEVRDGETNKPWLRLRPDGPWASEEIVGDDTYETGGGDTEAKLFERETARMKASMTPDKPAWQVIRYLPSDGRSNSPAYAAITACHAMIDGAGGLSLAQSLLFGTTLSSAPGLAPAMEDIIPIEPSISFVIREGLQELVLSKLPLSLRSMVGRQPCWPSEAVRGKPTAFSEAQSTLHIPAEWIELLKDAGKAQGVGTLHPTLQTSLLMALKEVMRPPKGSTMHVMVPHSERDSTMGHPEVGGVMVSSIRQTYKSSDIPPTDAFWSMAKTTAEHLASSKTRTEARYIIGALAYTPDPDGFHSSLDTPERRTPTGFEDFFWKSTERPSPFRTSLMISNLGKVKALPPGCDGMRWSQSAWPWEAAAIACMVGTEAGLEITMSFRDGCAISKDQAEKVLSKCKETLGDLIGVSAEGTSEI